MAVAGVPMPRVDYVIDQLAGLGLLNVTETAAGLEVELAGLSIDTVAADDGRDPQ